ncbi:MAG: hypothetical protein QXK16_03420 [Sulfolobales archaeon]
MRRKVYLGESLSTLIAMIKEPHPQDLIADLWERGSLLGGIEVCGMEFDRVPMLSKNLPGLPKLELISVKPAAVFIGSESSYNVRVSRNTDVQRNWLLELSIGGKIPKKFFNGMFKELRSRVTNERVYDILSRAELSSRKVRFLRYGTIDYCKLVSSLPLPYVMGKAVLNSGKTLPLVELNYVSLLVEIALAEYKIEEYTVIYVGKSNIIPHTVVLIPLRLFKEDLLSDYVLVYSITSIKRPYRNYKGEYVDRLLKDVRKLGFQDMRFLCHKLIFEKYGLLGTVGPEVGEVVGTLKDFNVELIGRLGTWKEMSIDEILNYVSI